jgi:hypothetical protein
MRASTRHCSRGLLRRRRFARGRAALHYPPRQPHTQRECRVTQFYTARGPASARSRLGKFYAHCDSSGLRERQRLAATIRAWEVEILAFHSTALAV